MESAHNRTNPRRVLLSRDSNFVPPLPASPRMGFPRPTKVVRQGRGEILAPLHGARWDGFKLLDPSCPSPFSPRVDKDYNFKFFIP